MAKINVEIDDETQVVLSKEQLDKLIAQRVSSIEELTKEKAASADKSVLINHTIQTFEEIQKALPFLFSGNATIGLSDMGKIAEALKDSKNIKNNLEKLFDMVQKYKKLYPVLMKIS